MNRITLQTPWPSTPAGPSDISVSFACPGHTDSVSGRVWDFVFYLGSVCRPQTTEKGNSKSCQCRNPNLFTSLSLLGNPEWECILLGPEGAARTINNIFPPRWYVAVLFLTRGWMSVVVNAQSCDLLWFERFCKNVRNSSYTPAWPIIHSVILQGQTHLCWEPTQGSLLFTNPFRIKLTGCCAETPKRHLHIFYLSHHQSLIWAPLRDLICWAEFHSLTTSPPPSN